MMLGVKEFFKYFWKYFNSKDCAIKKIMLWIGIVVGPIALLFVCTGKDFDGEPFSFGTKILYFIGVYILALGPFVPILGIILGRRLALFRKEVDKLSYNDLKNKKEYYRDFLINYSPAVLSYIDDFNVEEKDIVATVLNLELKGYLKIEQDKIIIISNDESKLDSNEKCILKYLRLNSFNPKNILNEFRLSTYNDVNKQNLLCAKKVRRSNIIKSLLKWTLIVLGIAWGIEFIFKLIEFINSEVLEIILTIIAIPVGIPLLVAIILYPTAAISYCIFAYLQTFIEITMYRTEESEKINENIEGLKNFLKDFSLLAEREREEIELWDRYLIYSVMFGQNKEIVKDFEKYYN